METLNIAELQERFETLARSPGLTPVQRAFISEFGRELCKRAIAASLRPRVWEALGPLYSATHALYSATHHVFDEVKPRLSGMASDVTTNPTERSDHSAPIS